MKNKILWLALGAAIALFALGLAWVGPWLVTLTQAAFGFAEVAVRPGELLAARLSVALLLALCAPLALVLVWSYWQRRWSSAPVSGYLMSLVATLASALAGIGIRLL